MIVSLTKEGFGLGKGVLIVKRDELFESLGCSQDKYFNRRSTELGLTNKNSFISKHSFTT